jgi:methyl-accepting chemotaxis protein
MSLQMNLGIKARTILPLVAILVLALSGLAVFNYYSQVSLLNTEAEASLRNSLNSAQSMINERLKQYQQMATLVGGMPSVADTFARKDRKKLISEFLPGWTVLHDYFKVAQFQFHLPPATSFLRLHQLEKYGDDLSKIRHTIVYANEKKEGTRGIEVGRGGLGLRGVMPVFSKGRHIGAVEFGGDLAPAIDEAKSIFNVEAAVFLATEATTFVFPEFQKTAVMIGNHALLYATRPQLAQGLVTAPRLAAAQRSGGIYTTGGTHAGREYYMAIAPLADYSGKGIGYLAVFKDQTELLGKIRRVLLINIVIYATLLMIISLAINFSLKKTVIDPVLSLTKAADEVSMGKLGDKIEVQSNDEISTLAKSLDRMRVSMKKLLE